MPAKPSDFFLGAIEFFGVLVPGGFFLLLTLDLLLLDPRTDREYLGVPEGVWSLLAAYVLGQLLFAVGQCLEPLYWAARAAGRAKKTGKDRRSLSRKFYRAFSYVRLNGQEAIGELERQAAAYKLLRTLAVVFFADAMISSVACSRGPGRVWTALVLVALCTARSAWLMRWTEHLAFDFQKQIRDRAQITSRPRDNSAPVR